MISSFFGKLKRCGFQYSDNSEYSDILSVLLCMIRSELLKYSAACLIIFSGDFQEYLEVLLRTLLHGLPAKMLPPVREL